MKVRFYRWYNAVLTVLLSMLGFGCSSSDDDMLEYGTPHADFILKGQVTDEAGTPIKNIKTSAKIIVKSGTSVYKDEFSTAQTDDSGRYELKYDGQGSYDLKIILEDVDGEANGGEFQSDTINVWDLPKKEVEKGSGWYEGKFEVNANIRLEKKK